MAINFPATLEIKNLRQCNPEYHAGKLQDYEALYKGSDLFRCKLDDFLIKRKVEESNSGDTFGIQGNSIYKERTKWAQYVNRAGGLIDWLGAAVFPSVELSCEPEDEYWESLNTNADGRGTPLDAVARKALAAVMVQGRAYFYPELDDEGNFRIRTYRACDVDDWQYDGDALLWVRVHSLEPIRSNDLGPVDGERETWTYVTDSEIVTYAAEKTEGQTEPLYANIQDRQPHDFGVVPVFPIEIFPGQWVMDRIKDVVVALFNAEAGLSFSVALQAYSQLVFKLDNTKPDQIVLSELAAIRLSPEESVEYLSPNPGGFDPQFKNIERLKLSFYEVLQSMSKSADQIPQAGRLSGDAVKALQSPLQVLLASLGWPVLIALRNWVDAVQKFRRDEDKDIEVEAEIDKSATMDEMKEAAVIGEGPKEITEEDTEDGEG